MKLNGFSDHGPLGRRCIGILLLTAVLAVLPAGRAQAALFVDDFNSGASALWGDESGSWAASGGEYQAQYPANYPNAHSTLPFELQDFEFEVDVNNVYDGGIWLRAHENDSGSIGALGVLLVTKGNGLYWHIVTGSSYGGSLNQVGGLFAAGSDIHLRVTVSGDIYSAYLGDGTTPVTTLSTSAFSSGRVGLYEYDSRQAFDNAALNFAGVPIPGAAWLLGSSLLGLVGLRKKIKG